MGGSSQDSSSGSSGPWKGQAPYLKDLFARAQKNANQPVPTAYPDSGVAPQSPYTQQGIAGLGGYGSSAYNSGVVGSAANSLGTLTAAQTPGGNPVSQVGYALAPGSTDFLQQTMQRPGSTDYSLFPSISQINSYIARPTTQNINPLSSEGFGSALSPGVADTLSRLQNQYNPLNIQTPTTSATGAENLSGATTGNTAAALNAQLTQTPGSNPYVDQLVQRALAANTLNFNQNVMPRIANNAELGGGYGGSRQGVAEGLAVQGLNTTNADTAANIYSNQYNQDLQRQLSAAGLGANVTAMGSNAELARTAADRGYGLDTASLQANVSGQDLARQLAAAQAGGSTALSGDQLALARANANNTNALNLGNFDLSRGQLGLSAGSAQQNYLQNAIGQGLNASQIGLNTLQSGFGDQLDAATRALSLAPTAQGVGSYGSNAALTAGQLQDQYQQSIINDLMQKYYFNQAAPTQQLQNYAQLIGGGSPTSQTTGATSSSGGVAGALGGGLATYGGLMSTPGAAALTPWGWGAVGLGSLLGSGWLG